MISQSDHKPGRNCPFRQLCHINQANRSILGPIYGSWQLWTVYCTSEGTPRPVVGRRDRLATNPICASRSSRIFEIARNVPQCAVNQPTEDGTRLAIAPPRKLARGQNSRGPDLCHQSENSGQMKLSLLDVRSRDPSSVAVHLWACTADMLQHVVLSLAGLTSCCRMKKITGLQDALKTRNSAWG
jgi:hypothetical protein